MRPPHFPPPPPQALELGPPDKPPPLGPPGRRLADLSARLRGLKYKVEGRLEVPADDLRYLEEGEYLNDTLIEAYLLRVREDVRREGAEGARFLERCFFFSTFFYQQIRMVRPLATTPSSPRP